MQVGDLVELSAYGKNKKYDNQYLLGKVGLVIDHHPGDFYWKVHWFGVNSRPFFIGRRDIKHVKAKKTLDKTTSV